MVMRVTKTSRQRGHIPQIRTPSWELWRGSQMSGGRACAVNTFQPKIFSYPHSPRTPSRTPFFTPSCHTPPPSRHNTQSAWSPPPSTTTSSGFFILPTAFPNPHIHPGGKGGQPPASKLPYCSKPVAFKMRIKHIRYIISLHLALPRMRCLNVIA